MPSQFGGLEVSPPAAGVSQFGGIPVDMRARNIGSGSTDEPEEKQGFFRSFYDGAVGPVVGMVKDAYKRGDLGEHAAEQLLDAFTDQVKNFAGHPDIRNLPIIGTGATATAAKMQKQFDAGNYSGMLGSAAGFLGQFAAPELIKRPPGLVDLPESVANGVRTAGNAAKAGVKAAAPDVAMGTAKAAAGVVAGKFIPHEAQVVLGIPVYKGVGQIAKGVGKGVKAAREALNSEAEVPISPEDEISAPHPLEPAAHPLAAAPDLTTPPFATPRYTPAPEAAPAAWEPGPSAAAPSARWEPPAAATRAWEPGPSGSPEPPVRWEPSAAPAHAWEPGRSGTPEPAARWEPYAASNAIDTAPDVRATLPPDLVARVDELRAASHPGLSDAQILEDAVHEHAARLQGQAQDLEWAARARKADRFADYLLKNKLDPTPENLAKATKALAERAVPSDETVPMIQDRMNYQEPAAEAPLSELEQKMADSIELFNKSKAAFDAAKKAR